MGWLLPGGGEQSSAAMPLHGTMLSDRGKFGFIQQDSGEEDMFVMPAQCPSFGGVLPPLGTRVVYEVATDPTTGRPRAENVAPHLELDDLGTETAVEPVAALEGWPQGSQPIVVQASPPSSPSSGSWYAGTMLSFSDKFGFIQQDSGEPDMFVMPLQCEGFGCTFPPIGSRVVYTIGIDTKTGRPRAEHVTPEMQQRQGRPMHRIVPAHPAQQMPRGPAAPPASGIVVHNRGKYGFLRPDDGGADIFLMPAQCIGFGGNIPLDGTRVSFVIGTDPEKGLPTASDVRPEQTWTPKPAWRPQPSWRPEPAWHLEPAWRPAWRPEPAWHPAHNSMDLGLSTGGQLTGTMLHTNGKFGFIQQDSGEEDMFVMPIQCHGFGGELPPIGARVVYGVAVDPKTGRLRAENVEPEWSGGYGKGKGKAKGAAKFSRPY